MKYFIAVALIAAVASASYIKPKSISAEATEIQEIIAAINSPSTDPATAAALEELLLDVLSIHPTPVQVGPAIVEQSPVSVGPAIIDFPLPDGGAVTEDVIAVSPVVVAPTPAVVAPVADAATSAPLVQIILNINEAAVESSPVAVAPVVVPEAVEVSPVQVIDNALISPVQVVDHVPVSPLQVVDHVPVLPVQVVDNVPVVVEPVIVGTPVLPAPAVVLPEALN